MSAISLTRSQITWAGSAPNLYGSTGEYWSPPLSRTTTVLSATILSTIPVYVPRTCTIDRIAAEITAGAVGSTLTLGVYEDDGVGNPGVLLIDAGTIDGNSATAQEKTISQALQGGRLYHLAALCAGGTPTARTTVGSAGGFVGRNNALSSALGASTSIRHGRTRSGVAGTALPSPAATTIVGSALPAVAVRFA